MRHNVLMIATDDMRPELSVYGNDYMSTPNLQSLADDGYFMRRAFVQQALCAPSRTVLLTSRRPDTSRVWTIGPYFRETTGRNWTTLPQAFKEQGYRSIGHGKIFHEGNASGFPLDQDQEYGSWSVPYFHPSDPYDQWPRNATNRTHSKPHSHLEVDEPWQTFNDAKSALRASEWIANASEYDDPFFLAVGFHRPHIPYVYPKEFSHTGQVTFPPADYKITDDVPACAPHDWTGEGDGYGDLHSIA
jgi:iduronate 2-sulfatase